MTGEDPRVERLLDELLDSRLTPEQVCAESPELLPMVRKRWRKLKRLGVDLDSLFPVQGDRPPVESQLPQIPGYEVEAVLGRGGLGINVPACHRKCKRRGSVKV